MQKQKAKDRQESKRSSFESQVAKTRKDDVFSKAAAEHRVFTRRA